MNQGSDIGFWELSIIMMVIASWILYRYVAPKDWREWTRAGLVQAFIIALYAEMYGFPLTIYLLTGWLGIKIPWAHDTGHLWAYLFGWGPLGAMVEMVVGYTFVFAGISLLAEGWREVYLATKEGRLAIDNLYGVVRHPQYTGIWEHTLGQKPEMFGRAPSEAAYEAAEIFAREGSRRILELGAGQGRDTVLLAEKGFAVVALDYAESGLGSIRQKFQALGLCRSVNVLRHDVRDPLPFRDESFDACYSHMLYCMALKLQELESLSAEVWRVLRPGGINIYTVRNTEDGDYGNGIYRGEDLYEVGGFIVQFFSREKVFCLARDWEVLGIDQFAEGKLPRKLFLVTLRKPIPKHLN